MMEFVNGFRMTSQYMENKIRKNHVPKHQPVIYIISGLWPKDHEKRIQSSLAKFPINRFAEKRLHSGCLTVRYGIDGP